MFYHLLTQLKYRSKCNFTSEINVVLIQSISILLLLYSILQGLESIRASDVVQSPERQRMLKIDYASKINMVHVPGL